MAENRLMRYEKNIWIQLSNGLVESLLAYSLLKLIYGRIKMREFSIGCGSVSEDEVIDERIEIHISISGKVLCSLATESVCDIRMNDSIKLTEDSS